MLPTRCGIAGARPWLKRPSAQVLGTMFELDGRPSGPIRATRWQGGRAV
ncbi:MAG: hypothetical protein IPF50_18595 [Proteobacteria bacterium]|nr:hypothetical protein [Pseudomonadota bacterium]